MPMWMQFYGLYPVILLLHLFCHSEIVIWHIGIPEVLPGLYGLATSFLSKRRTKWACLEGGT